MSEETKNRRDFINQVRQVLMNELGLTRDSIREMTREIVAECVAKEVKVMCENGIVEKIVTEKLECICRENKWDRNTFRGLLVAEAEKQMREFIRSRITISGAVSTGE